LPVILNTSRPDIGSMKLALRGSHGLYGGLPEHSAWLIGGVLDVTNGNGA
jgi:hypothetical protein